MICIDDFRVYFTKNRVYWLLNQQVQLTGINYAFSIKPLKLLISKVILRLAGTTPILYHVVYAAKTVLAR